MSDLREIHRLERLGFRFTEPCAKFRIFENKSFRTGDWDMILLLVTK